jgi:hypothetical protein
MQEVVSITVLGGCNPMPPKPSSPALTPGFAADCLKTLEEIRVWKTDPVGRNVPLYGTSPLYGMSNAFAVPASKTKPSRLNPQHETLVWIDSLCR